MAKSLLKIKARQMRTNGESIKQISKLLNISKSTASLWTSDISLSKEQLERLKGRQLKGAELGRYNSAILHRKQRLLVQEKYRKEGLEKLKTLTKSEFFAAGIALYWAEGAKKSREIEFCNQDLHLVLFMIRWFNKFLSIKNNEIQCRVGINETHRAREEEIKEYWSKHTGIPLGQFHKTSFKKVKNQKIYQNPAEHYGTLVIKISKPILRYYQMMGLIEGLYEASVKFPDTERTPPVTQIASTTSSNSAPPQPPKHPISYLF